MTKTYDPGTYQYMNSLSIHKKADKKKVDEEKIISRMYAVCGKYKKSLDEIDKSEITKNEYKHLLDFLEIRGYNTGGYLNYPNLA